MAVAQAAEGYQTVLDTVWSDMLDYMEPLPVLGELLKHPSPIQRRTLRDLKEKSSASTEKVEALLKIVKDNGRAAYDLLKQCLRTSEQTILADLLEAAEKGENLSVLRERLQSESGLSTEDKLLIALKEDLITHYLENDSKMPIAPLVERHDTELTRFYVRPPIMAYKKPNAYGQEKQPDKLEKTQITSYRDLLFNNNEPYRKIYITADAGMGKTSFSKMLARTWCQAHKQDMREADKFDEEDLDTVMEFELVFLIHLRDYQSKNICSLDDMILCILNKLPGESRYSKELIEQVLREKNCLIIVDGLDEWIHPMECENTPRKEIPHTKSYRRCSVLTTTRSWKFSTAQLSTSDVDRHLEISQLDNAAAQQLETLAIKFLNENRKQTSQSAERAHKSQDDFEKTATVRKFGNIRYIPYILLQMVCLWFENKSIGKSLCEVYSNIVELTLTRWLVKSCGHKNCDCNPPDTNIKCIKDNTHCRCNMALLLNISKLAFYSLFQKVKEDSLLFGKDFAGRFLCKEDLDLCLEIGLLSQLKDTTTVSCERYRVMFPHKSIQEYFAAIHIASNLDEDTSELISSMCSSLSNILELSNVFVFVCGINPERFLSISRDFRTIVSEDQIIIENRKLEQIYVANETALSYQSMQVACFEESVRNEHDQCQIILDDIILSDFSLTAVDDLHALVKIIATNVNTIKSLFISFRTRAVDIDVVLQVLVRSEFPSVESIHVESPVASISTCSFPSLKYLSLQGIFLTKEDIRFVSNLNNLEGLSLYKTTLENEQLIDYVNNCKSLKKLIMIDVHCSPYDEKSMDSPNLPSYDGESKDSPYLSSYDKEGVNGPYVSLSFSPVSNLNIQTESLTDCIIDLTLSHLTTERLLHSIQTNTMLTTLRLSITCNDHGGDCSGFALDLGYHSKLENLNTAKVYMCFPEIPIGSGLSLTELHVHIGKLVNCSINMAAFSADALSSFLAELSEAQALEELTLGDLRHSDFRVVIPELRRLVYCGFVNCDLGDSILSLSLELTSLETLVFTETKMNKSSWTEVLTSISKLPQIAVLELESIEVTADQWREIFLAISKQSRPFTLSLSGICTTLTVVECREFVTSIFEIQQLTTVKLDSITVYACEWNEVPTCLSMLHLPVTVELWNFRSLTINDSVHLREISVTGKHCTHIGFGEPIIVQLYENVTTNRWKEAFSSISMLPELATVRLQGLLLTLTLDQWRDVFTSLSKLPHSVTVEMRAIVMTAKKWRELMFDIIGKIHTPHPRNIELVSCGVLSNEQWEDIVCELKSSPAFHIQTITSRWKYRLRVEVHV